MTRDERIKDYIMKFYYACLLYAIIGFSWGAVMGGIPHRVVCVCPPRIPFISPRPHAFVLSSGRLLPFLFGTEAGPAESCIIPGIFHGDKCDRVVPASGRVGAIFPVGRRKIVEFIDKLLVLAISYKGFFR